MELGTKKPKGLWSIPISVGVGKKISSKLLTTKTSKIKLNQQKIIPIVNSSRKGFFRVKYDKELLSRIKFLVENKNLIMLIDGLFKMIFLHYVLQDVKEFVPI